MQTWVNQFTSHILPSKNYLDDANRQSEYMIGQLKGKVDLEEGLEISRILIGGSNATHTTITNLEKKEFDVDIHVYLKGEEVEKKQLRRFLKKLLIQIYPNKETEDFVTTKSSVKVIFKGRTKLNVDVVPVVHDTTRQGWWGYIPRPNGEKLVTSVPMHIEWVRSKTKSSNPPVKFNKMVRLMKWWNKYQKINVNSFSVNILTGLSFNEATFSSQWNSALQQVFKYFYSTWGASNSDADVLISDPINSENNAASSWTSSQLEKFKKKAMDAEASIRSAQSNFSNGDHEKAIKYLIEVFGEDFSNAVNKQ